MQLVSRSIQYLVDVNEQAVSAAAAFIRAHLTRLALVHHETYQCISHSGSRTES